MKILTPQTDEAKKAPRPDEPLVDLGGAYYLAPEKKGDPVLFVLLPADKTHKILDDTDEDRRALHIVAASEDRIRRILHQRYPAPRGGTMLWRVKSIFRSFRKKRETYYGRTKYEWQEQQYDHCFVLLDKPMFPTADTPEKLQALTQEHGPVLLTKDQFEEVWGGEPEIDYRGPSRAVVKAEGDGFVVTPRANGLWQVNYNPEAFDLREYRERLRAYEARAASTFPEAVLQDIFKVLSPDNWPHDHPFEGVCRTLELEEKRGWGHTRTKYQGLNQVITLVKMNLKLWKDPWWRAQRPRNSHGNYYRSRYNTPLDGIVATALQHIHGVEEMARFKLAEKTKKCREYYVSYVDGCRQSWNLVHRLKDTMSADGCPNEPQDDEDVEAELTDAIRYWPERLQVDALAPTKTEEQYLKEHLPKEAREELAILWFCRWLRREAKAMEIEIPPKPVRPLTPGQEKAVALKRAKKRRQRAGTEPAGVQSSAA